MNPPLILVYFPSIHDTRMNIYPMNDKNVLILNAQCILFIAAHEPYTAEFSFVSRIYAGTSKWEFQHFVYRIDTLQYRYTRLWFKMAVWIRSINPLETNFIQSFDLHFLLSVRRKHFRVIMNASELVENQKLFELSRSWLFCISNVHKKTSFTWTQILMITNTISTWLQTLLALDYKHY